jgi:hypothetical protein
VLEDLPPFPFAVAQFVLAAPELRLGLERGILFPAGISHQPRYDHPRRAEGGHHDEMLRIVDCEAQGGRSKEVSEARDRQKAKQDRGDETADQREQQDHDEIGERGCREIGVKHEASQGYQRQRKAAEEELRG